MSSTLGADAAYEDTMLGVLQRQFTTPRPLPAGIRLDGKTAIVTGSNGGIGLEACRQLLGMHLSYLIMAVRSKLRGEAAAKLLQQRFPGATISVWIVDLESYDSIQHFADQCRTLPRIDIVILNAAGVKTTYTPNPTTGHETTIQINYLSTALLSILILPILKASKLNNNASQPSVLSIAGSETMYSAKFVPKITSPVLPQYDNPEGYNFYLRYAASKLLFVFFASRLAESVNPDDVLINVSNPGLARSSDLDQYAPASDRIFLSILRFLLGRSVGAAASVYLDATLARGVETHGSFISDWAIKPYPAFWYTKVGQELRTRLWEETMEELNFAGASKIISDLSRS